MIKLRRLACAFLLAATAAISASAAEKPKKIDPPDWIRRPTGEDLWEHYPKAAALLGIEGLSAVACTLDAFGRLEKCKAIAESPPGLGFGPAAIAMTPLFRMRPMTVNGVPTPGGQVTIPINFAMEPWEVPPPVLQVRSPEALPFARRVTETLAPDDSREAYYRRVADEVAFISDEVTPAAIRGDAGDAYRQAFARLQIEFRESYAADLAAALSLPDLKTTADFLASPGGAVIAPNDDLQAVLALVGKERDRALQSSAHRAFCARRECDPTRAVKSDPGVKPPTMQITRWAEEPSDDDIAAARPLLANWLNLSVVVRLGCTVSTEGLLADCEVVAEAPGGLGGGKAALGLANSYRVDPVLMSQGAGGERVAVDLLFPAANPGEPYSAPRARSPEALQLARQLVNLQTPRDQAGSELAAWVTDVADRVRKDVDPEVLVAATDALREASNASVDSYREQVASTDAAIFSRDQLASAVAFLSDPAKAQSLKRVEAALSGRLGRVLSLHQRVSDEARATFCQIHDCTLRRTVVSEAIRRAEQSPPRAPQPISPNPTGVTRTP